MEATAGAVDRDGRGGRWWVAAMRTTGDGGEDGERRRWATAAEVGDGGE